MQGTVDSAGRIVVPEALLDRLGLVPGVTVDLSLHGAELHVVPVRRTARLAVQDGVLVAESDTVIGDEDVADAIDAGRR